MAKDIKTMRADMLIEVYKASDSLASQGTYEEWKKSDEGKKAAAEIVKNTQTKAGKVFSFLSSDDFGKILGTVTDTVSTIKGGGSSRNTNVSIPQDQKDEDKAKQKRILGMHPLTFGVVTFSVVAIGGVFVWYKFIRK